jgi:hypothetical protein
MGRTDAFKQRRLQGWRLIKFLMLKNPKRFPHNVSLIRVATGVNQAFNELGEGRWKGDSHAFKLPAWRSLSSSGLLGAVTSTVH